MNLLLRKNLENYWEAGKLDPSLEELSSLELAANGYLVIVL
jgi:hypothetical protein